MKKYNFTYITTNLINGKQYVGDHSTNDLNDNYLGSGRPYLSNAIKKYGRKNFKREIIKICETKKEAFDLQEKYINEYNTLAPKGYNISPKGGHGVLGCFSEETKQKISNANLGKVRSEEARKKMSKAKLGNTYRKGAILSKETKEKIKEKRKLQVIATGWHHPKSTCEKISKSLSGRILSKETKEKLSNASLNIKKVVCEHCQKEFSPWGLTHHKKALLKRGYINKI